MNHAKKSKNHKFLFGYGNKNPKLFIILDSPSKFDLIKNKLIAGDQEKILKKALNAINVEKDKDTYITSFIKYIPKIIGISFYLNLKIVFPTLIH